MRTCSINGKTVSIFSGNKSGSPVIYLNTVSDEGRQVYEAAQVAGCPPFNLVAISNLDWNHDMAPWDSPAAFKKGEPFRRALTRTTTNFKDRQVLRRQHLPVPLCTFRGTHVPNHANVRVVDLHSLPRMFGPLHILLMHHDFLNEQPQQFRRQFLDVGVAPGF